MKRFITVTALILGFTLCVPTTIRAQFIPKEKLQKQNPLQKIYWESSFGLQIGNVTNIEISPGAGYEVAKNLYAGFITTYVYYQNNYYSPIYKTHIFGGSIYARYKLFDMILVQAEYQLLNYEGIDDFSYEEIRKTIPGYLLGIGYRQKMGEKMYGDFYILYNFNDTPDYPYNNPIFRITIGGFLR